MVVSKIWVLKRRPEGKPVLEDFECIEEELPPCQEREIIVEAEYVSVDPYIRYRVRQIPLNTPVSGSQVSRVIESKNKSWPVGSYIVCYPGWRSHTLIKKEDLGPSEMKPFVIPLPDIGSQPRSTALGILGMPGCTAYFGLLNVCQPKEGETVLVNGAGGAVGSAVVQIAKIKGCRVIAFAGTDEKVAWVKELGADYVYNYKTTDIAEALKEAAPEGIHCYFDNVGGAFTSKALNFMATYGRIAVCGAISTYNDEGKAISQSCSSPFNEGVVIWKELKIEGFIVWRWVKQYFETVKQLKEWIEEGKLKYKETETQGFENIPATFIGLFDGKNIGKAVVKV